MKIIYISIPITGLNEEQQREKASAVEEKLVSDGYTVYNPFKLADFLRTVLRREPTYEEIMQLDLKVLELCQEIYLCNGWSFSSGCMDEVEKSIELGLKFKYESHGRDYK